MTLSWPGGSLSGIDFTSPYAQLGSSANSLTIDTQTLNSYLAANGSNYSFSTLGASANGPGAADPTGAVLSTTGEAVLSGSGGSNAITVSTSLSDYLQPTSANGALRSVATALFTSAAAGDSQSTSTSVLGTQAASFLFTSDGTSPSNPFQGPIDSLIVPLGVPFDMGNSSTITLSVPGAKDQFAVSQVLTSTVAPEPASIICLLPLAVLATRRRRA